MGQHIPHYAFNDWIQIDDLEDGRYLLTFSDEGRDLLRHAQAGVIKDVEPADRDFTALWELVLEALTDAAWHKELGELFDDVPPIH